MTEINESLLDFEKMHLKQLKQSENFQSAENIIKLFFIRTDIYGRRKSVGIDFEKALAARNAGSAEMLMFEEFFDKNLSSFEINNIYKAIDKAEIGRWDNRYIGEESGNTAGNIKIGVQSWKLYVEFKDRTMIYKSGEAEFPENFEELSENLINFEKEPEDMWV